MLNCDYKYFVDESLPFSHVYSMATSSKETPKDTGQTQDDSKRQQGDVKDPDSRQKEFSPPLPAFKVHIVCVYRYYLGKYFHTCIVQVVHQTIRSFCCLCIYMYLQVLKDTNDALCIVCLSLTHWRLDISH